MSACSNAFRIASRTRVPATSRTLVPFLYQTPTIQQWSPARHPSARRNASSRPPKVDDDVPFEGIEDSLPPAIDDIIEPERQTTITGSERAAFQKLYQTLKAQAPPKGDSRLPPEIDQIADEWYEEDEDKDGDGDASLDTLFDKVLAGAPAPGGPSKPGKPRKPPQDLGSLAKAILKPEQDELKKKSKKEAAAEKERQKAMQIAERNRVKSLMEQAKTDRQLWDVLEREVLSVIRALDLDSVKETLKSELSSPSKGKRTKKDTVPPTSDSTPAFPTSPTNTPYSPRKISSPNSRALFANYPVHLYTAASLLRSNFPASALPLSILPTLKSIGRSSFALGASTSLYNLLIRTAWHQHASYDFVDELLHDMDNAGVEFDTDTLALLDAMLGECKIAVRGDLGQIVQRVWGMEMFSDGARRLRKWRDVVGERLGPVLARRKERGEMVRRVNIGKRGKEEDDVGTRRDAYQPLDSGKRGEEEDDVGGGDRDGGGVECGTEEGDEGIENLPSLSKDENPRIRMLRSKLSGPLKHQVIKGGLVRRWSPDAGLLTKS